MINPLLLVLGYNYLKDRCYEESHPKCCKYCAHFKEGKDYCEKRHYIRAISGYYCSDKKETNKKNF